MAKSREVTTSAHTLRSGLSLQPPYRGPLTRQAVKAERAKNKHHAISNSKMLSHSKLPWNEIAYTIKLFCIV